MEKIDEDRGVIYLDEFKRTIASEEIERLIDLARGHPKRIFRMNLHRHSAERLQEMIIAFYQGAKSKIHKHNGKGEIFHLIRGEALLRIYADDLQIREEIRVGSAINSLPFIVRVASNEWHELIPISEVVVIHELVEGPYNPEDTIILERINEEKN